MKLILTQIIEINDQKFAKAMQFYFDKYTVTK